ncbi:MAG: site-specific integrase [Acidobacteria bacterium]|nr:site-specific integrase [Acidobacteriota bacterium]
MKDKYYVERKGKLYARVYYTDSQGKYREIWRRAESKSEAKEIAEELRQQLKQGTEPFEHKGTLDEFLDQWLETQKQKVTERTYEDYVGTMRLYVRPILGKHKLADLRPLDIQSLVNKLVKKGLSPRTVRYAVSILTRALKRAVIWKLLSHNPATDVELPKYVKREMKSLTEEEAIKFLEACQKDKYGLMFELALITGLRPEEYLGLQWTDIDFQHETLTIRRTLVWKRWKYEWYFGEPKSEKSKRTLPLPSYLLKELTKWRLEQNEKRLKLGEEWMHYNLIFPSDSGTPLSIRNLDRRHFKPILVNAELPNIRLYDLRHSCATLLLADGENLKVVSERLGHADGALVLRTYSHCTPSMQKSATDRLERILKR